MHGFVWLMYTFFFSCPRRGVCGLASLKNSPPCSVSLETKMFSVLFSHWPFSQSFPGSRMDEVSRGELVED